MNIKEFFKQVKITEEITERIFEQKQAIYAFLNDLNLDFEYFKYTVASQSCPNVFSVAFRNSESEFLKIKFFIDTKKREVSKIVIAEASREFSDYNAVKKFDSELTQVNEIVEKLKKVSFGDLFDDISSKGLLISEKEIKLKENQEKLDIFSGYSLDFRKFIADKKINSLEDVQKMYDEQTNKNEVFLKLKKKAETKILNRIKELKLTALLDPEGISEFFRTDKDFYSVFLYYQFSRKINVAFDLSLGKDRLEASCFCCNLVESNEKPEDYAKIQKEFMNSLKKDLEIIQKDTKLIQIFAEYIELPKVDQKEYGKVVLLLELCQEIDKI